MHVGEVVASGSWMDPSSETLRWLARLLRDEGIDLMTAEDADLRRGTPVYVQAEADLHEVQRRIARNHIRRLPVINNGSLAGVVDLVELALRAEGGSEDLSA
jgi:CBS domain-containing protein